MKKSKSYFPHSCKLSREIKVRKLILKKGAIGYAILLMSMEYLWIKENFECYYSDLCEHLKTFDIEHNEIKSVINDFNLFNLSNGKVKYVFTKNGKVLKPFKKDTRLFNTNVKAWYEIRKAVFERDNYTCVYCGQVGGKLEADHAIPFSKGGEDTMENLVTACRRCNRQKKDKSVKDFMEWKKING